MFGGGCGCLPDTVIRWLVFTVLLLGGVAIVVAGRRRARRADATTSDGRRGATRATVAGVIEQDLFYVNQIMKFGKLLAVFQNHPSDASKTVVTAFMALAIKARVLDEKRDYENVPVLRNLVPAQVLMGQSSFNSGNSISAGLPKYARNEISTIAGILQKDTK